MPEGNEEMHGFEETGALPSPPAPVDDATKARLTRVLTAIVSGATPGEVARYLEAGFPDFVEEALQRPLEGQEMADHVDVLLATLQTPALSAAA